MPQNEQRDRNKRLVVKEMVTVERRNGEEVKRGRLKFQRGAY